MKRATAGERSLEEVGVVVTRAEPPGGPLARRLARRGARVLHWQAIEIAPPRDSTPLLQAIDALGNYDWIVFASVHAVSAFEKALTRETRPPHSRPRIAAVGRSTARALKGAGLVADLVPERHGGTPLAELLRVSERLTGARVLLPASSIARPDLARGLEALGARVDRVTAYQVRPAALDAPRCRAELAAGEIDVVTFTSPSAVESLAAAFGRSSCAGALGETRVVSIGPTTSGALRAAGLEPTAEADPHSLDGLVAAVVTAMKESAG